MKKILLFALGVVLTIFVKDLSAQCSNFDSQYPSATQTTTSNTLVTVSTCMYGGEYAVFDVTAGETYTWTTCGDTDFDTQLTLWNTSHTTSYAYNDDDCGTQSTITWTATFTGQVHVLVSEYNCSDMSTCMTLQWACTTCGSTPDPCASITPMACGTTYTGTLGVSYSYWDNYTDCSYTEPGEEIVFSFTPAATGDYTFSAANVSGDPDYFLMSSCDNTSTNIHGSCWGVGDITETLTGGVTYYVVVDNYSSSNNAEYELSVDCSAVSGPCASVTPMSCGNSYTGTLGTASSYWNSYTGCSWNEPGEEVVYSFTPPVTGDYTFTGVNVSGDPDYFLMSSCDNTSTNIHGSCWGVGDITETLTGGVTYYVIIDNYSSSNNAEYDLSIDCSSAIGATCPEYSTIVTSAADHCAGQTYYFEVLNNSCNGDIYFDVVGNYGSSNAGEITWEVTSNLTSNVISSGGPGTNGANINVSVGPVDPSVEGTTFTLTVFDSLGDGFNGTGGYIVIEQSAVEISPQISGNFGSEAHNMFIPDIIISNATITITTPGGPVTQTISNCQDFRTPITINNSLFCTTSTVNLPWEITCNDDGSVLASGTHSMTISPNTPSAVSDIVDITYDPASCQWVTNWQNDCNLSHLGDVFDITPDPTAVSDPCAAINPETFTLQYNGVGTGLPCCNTAGPAAPITYSETEGTSDAVVSNSPFGGTNNSAYLTIPGNGAGGSATSLTLTFDLSGYCFDHPSGDPTDFWVTILVDGSVVYDTEFLDPATSASITLDETDISGYNQNSIVEVYVYPNTFSSGSTNTTFVPGIGCGSIASGEWTASSFDLSLDVTFDEMAPTPITCSYNANVVKPCCDVITVADQSETICSGDPFGLVAWQTAVEAPNPSCIVYSSVIPVGGSVVPDNNLPNGINGGGAPIMQSVSAYAYCDANGSGSVNAGDTYTLLSTYDLTVNPILTPAFTALGPYCVGDVPAVLPTTSTNGVTGSWSPAAISTAAVGTTVYTFTPNVGECANSTTMSVTVNPIPDATITPQADLCENDAAVTLNAATAGGIWSGTGVSGNSFDPTSAGAGDHVVTYDITVGSCTDTDNITIHVDAMPDATITPVGPYCITDAAVILSAVSAGGTWSGTGITNAATGEFDPSTAGAGSHTITYTVSNGVCTDVDNITIVVDPMPDATITPAGPFCLTDGAVLLSSATAGGTWSGTGITNATTGEFDPATAGAGYHTIIYTVSNGVCTDMDNITIVVDPMPDATITPQADLCENDAAVTLNAVDGGGTWSGTGVSGTSFDPASAGAGDHVVTYDITVGSCTDTDNITIHVDAMPDATISPAGPFCSTDGSVLLSSATAGGTWSGTGITNAATGEFDPATSGAGSHTITYIVSNGVCTDLDNITIVVDPMPDATITPQADLCENDAAVTLNAATGGGVWSGTGVSGTSFDPASAGAGDHVVTYDITVGSCTDTDNITIHVDAMPDATISPAGPFCSTDGSVLLSSATAGGTWSGTGITNAATGEFDPATSGAGSHTITYIVSNGVCTDLDNITIVVDPMPDATITPQADLCENDAAVTLNAATGGGVWSGTGVSVNSFDPATAGAGDHFVTYDITVGSCTDTDNITIHVDAMPDATITPVGPYCITDAVVTLSAATAGGTWSGTGITNAATGEFDPATAGAGSHTITYTVSNGVCTDVDNITIVVDPMPDATITPQADLCENDATVTLNAIDGGGTWSGTSVNGTSFDPSSAGAGDHVVTYDITVGSCTDTDNITIHVDAMPDASITPAGPFCSTDGAVLLSSITPGGTWSGPGITNTTTGEFDPSLVGLGDYIVTYTVSNGVCTDSDNITIHVDDFLDATITPQADLCENDAAVILNAVDAGGMWTGTGIVSASTGEFDPMVSGYGDHVISYSVGSGVCSDTDNITIHVDAMPDATIIPVGPYCITDAAVTLSAVSAGGTWSGTGITNTTTGEFDPATAGAGSHTITYTVSNGVCTDVNNITIVVDPMPDATITPQADLCENDAAMTLNAVDGGGTWSGTGVSGNSFDPASAGSGDHVVTYDITVGSCTDTDNITIHVDAMPDATITPAGPFCVSDAAVTLSAATAGGTWSGPGVSGNSFDPATAGAGSHTIIYTVSNGVCTDMDNITIVVDPMPDATITPQADLCENDAAVTLNAATGGGSWSGTGVSGNSFDPISAGAGNHVVTYDITVGSCTDTDNITIHVDAMPDATITPAGPFCVSDAAVTLSAATAGGTWSGLGVSGNSFDLATAGAGSHTITYTVSNGVCTDMDNITIVVDPMPDATITPQADLCENEAAVILNAATAGGIWSGTGVSGNSFDPASAGSGDHVVTYDITVGSCTDTDNITIHVDAMPDATITSAGPFCVSDAAVALSAATAGGTWSGPGVSGNSFDPATAGAGSHTITYTVSNGVCTDLDNITIVVDPMPDAIITLQADLCENEAAVILNAATAGGIWSGPGVSGNSFDPVSAGAGDHFVTYDITVGSCTDTDNITIHVDAMPDATITPAEPFCVSDAAVTLSAATAGGTWSGPGVSGNSFDPATAGAGSHIITYTVSNGVCTDVDNVTIVVDPMPDATITPQADLCIDVASVVLNSATAGGTWSGAGVSGNSFNPGIAGAGTHTINYTITVGSCTDTDQIQVTVNDIPAISVLTAQYPLCYGESTGYIEVYSPGSSTATYNWSGLGTDVLLSNLSAGSYTVIVTDNGCVNSETIVLSDPSALNVSIVEVDDVTCHAFMDGQVVVTASGGTGSYDYLWSNSQTLPVLTNVSGGDYQLTVTDDNDCEATLSVHVNEPDELTLAENVTPVMCGVSPGACQVTANGGNGGYVYSWDGYSSTSPSLTGLSGGLYTVHVNDVLGCSTQTSMMVPVNGNLSVGITEDQSISCFGESNAVLRAECPGGAEPLDYYWSPTGDIDFRIENLNSGIYSVQVSDDWGCSGQATHHVIEPDPINLNFAVSNVHCANGSDGQLVALPSGGTGPYTIYWPGYGVNDTISNLTSGYYNVQVTDVHNCELVDSAHVSEPDVLLTIDLLSSNISCYGFDDGRATAFGVGGTPPYTYDWHFETYSSEMQTITNLPEGFYSLLVTDAYGCAQDTMIVISEPAPMMVDYLTVNPSCIGNNDGNIEFEVVGGVEPYVYQWDLATANLPYFDGLYEGSYEVSITDANGCEYDLETITLMDVPEECLRIPDAFTPNGDNNNDTWIIENIEMFPNSIVKVFNRWGQAVYEGKHGDEPWDGKDLKDNFVPTGSYIYVIKLYNATEAKTGVVTVIY